MCVFLGVVLLCVSRFRCQVVESVQFNHVLSVALSKQVDLLVFGGF